MAKPAKYYVCCDSEAQRTDAQNLMKNIERKTGKSYGQNLVDALEHYNNILNGLKN